MSANGRLISSPRTAGTMQKAQVLSQPIWIVTQALYDVVRRAGSADGNMAWSSTTAASRISVTGPPRRDVVEQLGGAVDVVRAHHDVDVAGLWRDDVAVLLGEAAGHDDLAAVALRLPRLQVAEVAVQLVVGVLADAARVQHDDVGVGLGRRGDHPVGLEQSGDALGVVLVHLTAERAHEVATAAGTSVRLPAAVAPGPGARR